MEYKFTTNSRMIDLISRYKNTFVAFCELINNSIHAKAKEIRIDIDEKVNAIGKKEIREIKMWDNGVGVSKTDFKKKILEIGTDAKPKGKGIGRFAVFQIGSFAEIETVSYDKKEEKYVKTIFPFDHNKLSNSNMDNITLKAYHDVIEDKAETYYQVKIAKIYNETDEKEKKIHRNLFLDNINEALFLQYPLEIIKEQVSFYINDHKLKKEDFIIGNIETKEEVYIDKKDIKHSVKLTFINYKSSLKDILVFFRVDNGGIKTIGYEYRYSFERPEPDSWVVYVDSKMFDDNVDPFRNLMITNLDQDSEHLKNGIKELIDKFFKDKFKDYIDFSKQLKSDTYYPYRSKVVSSDSKAIVFNEVAYCIEKEHKILTKKDRIRKIIYPLVDKAINHGDLTYILEQIGPLEDKHIKRFRELLNRAAIEEVIKFSEEVAKKKQTLEFISDLIYGNPSKYIKERSQLHKIVEKNLWLFGEEYSNTPILFSDKSLKTNLIELRKKFFEYEPSKEDDNLQEIEDVQIRGITDLFFFNEKIKDDQKREVMIVELKRPSCKISQKELNQLEKYRYSIGEGGKFSNEISFKIILIGSDLTGLAKSSVGKVDPKNPFLNFRDQEKNIETWVLKWSDLIHLNNNKLSYMGKTLKTKDINIKELFDKEYSDIDISNLQSI